MRDWIVLLILLVSLWVANGTLFAPIPVVYIVFGATPLYLQLNLELAARNNRVILISDSLLAGFQSHNPNVEFVDMKPYLRGATKFSVTYKHLSKDKSRSRYTHELRCFQRWIVLQDYVQHMNLTHVFFSDGDSSIFTNITQAYELRSQCDAMINVEYQPHKYHWAAAGEASFWTAKALVDFCTFTTKMYNKHIAVLETKMLSGSSVVDMSLLWLWWVAHTRHIKAHINDGNSVNKPDSGKVSSINNSNNSSLNNNNSNDNNNKDQLAWRTGRPYQAFGCNLSPTAKLKPCRHMYTKHDDAYRYATTLSMPTVDVKSRLNLCNGMDVVNRTTFDHMHGWQSGTGFRFNLPPNIGDHTKNVAIYGTSRSKSNFSSAVIQGSSNVRFGLPSTHAISQSSGGKPESLDYGTMVNVSQSAPLYFNTIHYQAGGKQYIPYDICRVLLLTGTRVILDPIVATACEETRVKHSGWEKCQNHNGAFWVKFSPEICA